MSRFVKIDSFTTGKLKIPTTKFTLDDLQECIDEQEESVLVDLLGLDLYNKFIADFDNLPVNEFSEARFISIYDKFWLYDNCYRIKSEGIFEMLRYNIYFMYMREIDTSKRSTGFQQEISDNATRVSAKSAGIDNIYNKFVNTYQAIQQYICRNPQDYDYDDFVMIKKENTSWL